MKKSGFTIIELLVVIVIITATLLLAGPMFSKFFRSGTLGSAVDESQKLISMARQMAIARNSFYAIEINEALDVMGIYSASADGTLDTSKQAEKIWHTPTDIDLELPTYAVSYRPSYRLDTWPGHTSLRMVLLFNPKGELQNGSARMSLYYLTDVKAHGGTDATNTVRVYRDTGATRVTKASES